MKTLFYALRYTDHTWRGKNYWVKISVNERHSIYKLEFLKEGDIRTEGDFDKLLNNRVKTLYLDPQEYKDFQEKRVGSKD